MGFLFDKYSRLKEKTKGMREAVDDVGKIAYDISKDNSHARAMRRTIRKG